MVLARRRLRILILLMAAGAACSPGDRKASAPSTTSTTTRPTTTTTTTPRVYDMATLGLQGVDVSPDLSNLYRPIAGYSYADVPELQADTEARVKSDPEAKQDIASARVQAVNEGDTRMGSVLAFRFADSVAQDKIARFVDSQVASATTKPQLTRMAGTNIVTFSTEAEGESAVQGVLTVGPHTVVTVSTQDAAQLTPLVTAFVQSLKG